MYWQDKWTFAYSTEYEIKYIGNYGAKGEKRRKKRKATPEQIARQNQQNKEKYIRRLIKANFSTRDYWTTLKYNAGVRKTIEEIQKDLTNFLNAVRRDYKKHGDMFKFIYRMEIGKHGGIHIHLLCNRAEHIQDTDMLIQKKWRHGRCNFQTLYEEGGYERLANYIVKQPEEQYGQLELFEPEERKQLIKYSCSRNLVRPEPERKIYRRWTVRKILEHGPQPTPGYYIDPDSVVMGENPYTGMNYIHYTECKLIGEQYEKS